MAFFRGVDFMILGTKSMRRGLIVLFCSTQLHADNDLNNLATILKNLSEQPASSEYAFQKTLKNGVVVAVSIGDPVIGNMLAQDADVVVDAANGDINPGTGVSGALYKAAGRPDVTTVWQRDKQPLKTGSDRRLRDGEAWFNTNSAVIAYYPDKGTGTPKNVMRIVHAVAPVCQSAPDQERELLIKAYKNALAAMDWWLRQPDSLENWNLVREQAGVATRGPAYKPSIVFPLLGSGVFGCDPKIVAECARQAIYDYFSESKNSRIGVIIIAPFTPEREVIVKQVFGLI